MPCGLFGSSGRVRQPASVARGFTRRVGWGGGVIGKAIVRLSAVRVLWTHAHAVNGTTVGPDLSTPMLIEPVMRHAPRFNLSGATGRWLGYEAYRGENGSR